MSSAQRLCDFCNAEEWYTMLVCRDCKNDRSGCRCDNPNGDTIVMCHACWIIDNDEKRILFDATSPESETPGHISFWDMARKVLSLEGFDVLEAESDDYEEALMQAQECWAEALGSYLGTDDRPIMLVPMKPYSVRWIEDLTKAHNDAWRKSLPPRDTTDEAACPF